LKQKNHYVLNYIKPNSLDKIMATSIKVKSPIKKKIQKSFRLFDFHVDNKKDEVRDKMRFYIQMFGINEEGESCSITIDDYKPFFYIKVPDNWKQEHLVKFQYHLHNQVGMDVVSQIELVRHKKLYGFSAGKEYQFAKLTFDTTIGMNKIKNLWYLGDKMTPYMYIYDGNSVDLELYESAIPPLLRFFHIQSISPSGWVQINVSKSKKPEELQTSCKYEYICSCAHIKPQPEKETPVPYKICSFDIEASSSHGDFPVPVKSYRRLASNIYDLFQRHKPSSEKQIQQFLQQIILTAFDFGKFEDVDLVYPINKPTKAQTSKLIKMFLSRSIKDAESSKTVQDMLTVAQMFESMKSGEDSDDEFEYGGKYKKKSSSSKESATIVDVLMNETYDREQKIQFTNTLLSAMFPKLEGDKITFIGSTFMNYGNTEPYLNHCLVLDSCDPVTDAEIVSCDNETELLLKWTQLIQQEDPDIVIGYNIFGFDFEFMFRRSEENNCWREFLQLSRISGQKCAREMYDKEEKKTKPVIENTKVVLASGEYDLRYYKMLGRLQIDMYTYFRKDYNLSSYKLDDVAGEFISDDIVQTNTTYDDAVEPQQITELYSRNLTGLNVGDYIHIELCSFTTDYYDGGRKFQVLKIDSKDEYKVISIKGHHVFNTKKIKWTMAKDDVTPQDIFRLANGDSSDRAIVAKYCIQDCNLVHHLMNKIDVVTGYVEMSSICSVPMSFLVLRGQGIKLTSYVAKKCREKNTLMPDLDKTGENEGYEGAIVLPPKCSMYMDNPVACVDYSSLYPSSMISQNYSHDSKVWTMEYNLEGKLVKQTGEMDSEGNFIYDNLPEYQYIDIEFDTYRYVRKSAKSKAEKVKSGVMKCRWAQLPNNEKSIMPAILEELLKARKATKKLMKNEKDPFMENILDKRQLGYKVTANSLYGQCGARTSTFYEKDVAASTTATGRMMIIYAKKMIEDVYGDRACDTKSHGPVLTKAEYVYGDSVASYTPVYIRVNGVTNICSIEEVAKYGNNEWLPYGETKEYIDLCNRNIDTWSDKGWTQLKLIIRHKLHPSKTMYRVQTRCGLVDVTSDHSLLNENAESITPSNCKVNKTRLLHKRLPKEQLTQYENERMDKNATCYSGNHVQLAKKISQMDCDEFTLDTTSKFMKLQNEYDAEVQFDNNDTIISMKEIPYSNSSYVFDLTTENHHFAAGIGHMIVHNTDSVFFTFNLVNPETQEPIRGEKALEITIEIAQEVADLCTQWLKPPMSLEYEKTLMPFILLSKKRYVGMLYETNPKKGKLKYMGLSLKRRDSCDYLKDTYGGILDILMKENNIEKAIEFLNQSLQELVNGTVPMDKLAITRALRSEYKNPNQIAHRVLADRIGLRDPGNKPKSGDRIKYVFIHNPTPKALLGDRVETPEFIVDNKMKIDYTYYITNQLMKPLQQLFGLALVPIWQHRKKTMAVEDYKKEVIRMEKDCGDDYELYMKRREKYCSAKIKTILFDKMLHKINNDKNNMRSLENYFGKR
jgi:DNA polymerase elongation subunit (family B)